MPVTVHARVGRLLVILVVLGASCLLGSGAAWAGGPTSALLVSPGNQAAAALYYADPEYDRLMTLLEPAPGESPADAVAPGADYITVTWLVHDVSLWRIDRIFLEAAGGPLVVTQLLDGSTPSADGMYPGQSGNDSAIAHRSTDPVALQALLTSLGLTGPAVLTAPITGPAGEAASATGAVGSGGAVDTAAVDTAAGALWWWAAAGLVLGIGVAALVIRYVPTVRRRFTMERDVIDGEPIPMLRLPV